MRYRTKPLEIEAIQYRDVSSLTEIKQEFEDIDIHIGFQGPTVWDYLQLTWVLVNEGDYIIKGLNGEYYPCAPDVFERKYEPIE